MRLLVLVSMCLPIAACEGIGEPKLSELAFNACLDGVQDAAKWSVTQQPEYSDLESYEQDPLTDGFFWLFNDREFYLQNGFGAESAVDVVCAGSYANREITTLSIDYESVIGDGAFTSRKEF